MGRGQVVVRFKRRTSFAGSPHVRIRSLTQPLSFASSSSTRFSNTTTSARRLETNFVNVTCFGGAGAAPM